MKAVQAIIFVIAAICAHSVTAKLQCKLPPVDIPKDWITMVEPCTLRMREQVQEELQAALTYMAMGAHFSRDTINRPGFAKLFFDAASEERQHAIKIISYLLMRGELTSEVSKLIQNPTPLNESWESGIEALKDALKLEAHVTRKIRDIIIACENPSGDGSGFNDYHLVDYLSGEFLDEQYKGQADLASKISSLGKMLDYYGTLGEFLFDKKLLNGEL